MDTFEPIGEAASRVVSGLEHPHIPDGQKVTRPGVYRMSIGWYHSDSADGPSISSSGLRTIEAKTPAHYWATSPYNPNRIAQEPNEAFDFGKAAHVLLLGEAGFRDQFAVRPEEWADWRSRDARAWRDEQVASGRTVITNKDITAIRGMAASLAEHPLIRAGLLQGQVERSIFHRDPVTGVWLRARPDILPEADGVVVDLKTTTDASPDAVQRAIQSFGYAMQGSVVGSALKAVLGVEMTDFVLVFVEKTPPYAVNVVTVDNDWIWYAGRQVRRAIDTFARCMETGVWPGFDGETKAYMPEWFRKKLDAEVAAGLLPEVTYPTQRDAAE